MSQSVRVGIVGTSEWTEWMYLSSLKDHPRTKLQAICGRNRTNAEAMAQKYAIVDVFTDYRDMLAQGDIKALIVASPDDTHYTITMDALDADLHVSMSCSRARQARACLSTQLPRIAR